MLISQKLKLDLLDPGTPGRIHAVQGECNTRVISAELFAGDVPWNVPNGVIVSMRYMKPDGTGGCYDTLPDGTPAWSLEGNLVQFRLAPQLLAVPGIVSAQLEFCLTDRILATFLFCIIVEPNPAEGLHASEDYLDLRHWMKREMEHWLDTAKENGLLDGKTGAAAVLEDSFVHYQYGESGTVHPTGTWQETVPAVTPGKYLWTRTTFVFNSGDPAVTYTVSRFGEDGSPGESLPATVCVSEVLMASGWSDAAPYIQSVAVNGLSESLLVRAYPDWPDADDLETVLAEEVAKISSCRRDGILVTFKCRDEKPELDIPVILEVYA